MKLKNKKVIITGGASGMGKATAELFCKEGAQVAILDINKNEGEKTTKIINDSNGRAFFFHTDLTRSKEVIIILPPFFLSIKGMTVLQTRNAERTLMFIK